MDTLSYTTRQIRKKNSRSDLFLQEIEDLQIPMTPEERFFRIIAAKDPKTFSEKIISRAATFQKKVNTPWITAFFIFGILSAISYWGMKHSTVQIIERKVIPATKVTLPEKIEVPKEMLPASHVEKREVIEKPKAEVPQVDFTQFKLVGISWDEHEFVAMIERGPFRKASFVRKNETLGNGIVINDIDEFSVILESGERTYRLT